MRIGGSGLPARHPTEGTSQADYSGLNLCFRQCSPAVSGAIGEIGVPSVPVGRARLLRENPAGCAAHLRSQQVRQVCRLITAARALGTLGTLGTARFHGCESTGDVFPGRELDILSLGWVRTRSIHGFSSRRRRRDCRSRPAKSLSSSTTPSSSPLAVFPPGHPVRHPPRRDIDASEHLDFRLPYPAHAMIEARQVTDEQKI